MKKLILCKGLPGCGKTTFARQWVKDNPDYIRINRDDIRAMFTPDFKWGGKMEELVTVVEMETLAHALHNQLGGPTYNVIIDNTNLNPEYVAPYIEVAQFYGAEVEWKDFTDVPLDICIVRDALRPEPVGEKVIRGMHTRYFRNHE